MAPMLKHLMAPGILVFMEIITQRTMMADKWMPTTRVSTEDIWWILEGQDYPRLWWEASD